jgi:hypothetical protein
MTGRLIEFSQLRRQPTAFPGRQVSVNKDGVGNQFSAQAQSRWTISGRADNFDVPCWERCRLWQSREK